MIEVKEGDVFDVRYPFYRDTKEVIDCDEDGCSAHDVECWVPGTWSEPEPPDNSIDVADGVGVMRLSVVSVHKPGKYPTRVFYVRTWIDPDGKEFGKRGLRVTTLSAFKRKAAGYGYEYVMSSYQ